jgi:hypothetical protein
MARRPARAGRGRPRPPPAAARGSAHPCCCPPGAARAALRSVPPPPGLGGERLWQSVGGRQIVCTTAARPCAPLHASTLCAHAAGQGRQSWLPHHAGRRRGPAPVAPGPGGRVRVGRAHLDQVEELGPGGPALAHDGERLVVDRLRAAARRPCLARTGPERSGYRNDSPRGDHVHACMRAECWQRGQQHKRAVHVWCRVRFCILCISCPCRVMPTGS